MDNQTQQKVVVLFDRNDQREKEVALKALAEFPGLSVEQIRPVTLQELFEHLHYGFPSIEAEGGTVVLPHSAGDGINLDRKNQEEWKCHIERLFPELSKKGGE